MIIAEQFIQGKHDEATCEDGIVVTPHFVAAIDGSTSKGSWRVDPRKSNGRYCMETIAAYIEHMPADITLDAFCQGITKAIHDIYAAHGLTGENKEPLPPVDRLCASAAIYSQERGEVWMIGDCQCIVNGKLHDNGKPYESLIAEKRAAAFKAQQSQHPDMTVDGELIHDYARESVLPELVKAMDGENKTYAVIDGYPIFRDGIKVIKVNLDATPNASADGSGSNSQQDNAPQDIVLATDGYPFLCTTLEKSERKLKKQLSTDPFNIGRFKATKGLMRGNRSFDDRAYVRFSPYPAQRYFLTLSFDGTAYHGWQIQPNGMSAQERLQDALTKILRRKIDITGAGRTDAGVHARTMVCHFDDRRGLNCQQVLYRLNQLLPADIACRQLKPVPDSLHARFSAVKRTYRYFIHTGKDPFARHFSVETHYPLDFPLMNEAAEKLTHITDFKAFCKADSDARTTICHVTRAQWVQTSPTEWYFEISADRFLRNMVRAVVGTLFDVGRHRVSMASFCDIIANGSRSDSGESMPAKGLFLWDVEY